MEMKRDPLGRRRRRALEDALAARIPTSRPRRRRAPAGGLARAPRLGVRQLVAPPDVVRLDFSRPWGDPTSRPVRQAVRRRGLIRGGRYRHPLRPPRWWSRMELDGPAAIRFDWLASRWSTPFAALPRGGRAADDSLPLTAVHARRLGYRERARGRRRARFQARGAAPTWTRGWSTPRPCSLRSASGRDELHDVALAVDADLLRAVQHRAQEREP